MHRVDKPWGHELIWAHTDRYVGKILFVRAGCRLSLQYHRQKDETFLVLEGEAEFSLDKGDGPVVTLLKEGDVVRVQPGQVHRTLAVTDVRLVEVSTPELDDVVRLGDDYGRAREPDDVG